MATQTQRTASIADGSPDESWSAAQAAVDQAAERLQLDDGMRRVLRVPKRELTVHFPVTLESGDVQVFAGYRVHHNINRGPASGGIRFTPDLTLDLVRAQAMLNTWKAALVGIPYGGAAGSPWWWSTRATSARTSAKGSPAATRPRSARCWVQTATSRPLTSTPDRRPCRG